MPPSSFRSRTCPKNRILPWPSSTCRSRGKRSSETDRNRGRGRAARSAERASRRNRTSAPSDGCARLGRPSASRAFRNASAPNAGSMRDEKLKVSSPMLSSPWKICVSYMIRSLPKRRWFSRCSNSWVLAESASKRAHGEIALPKNLAQRRNSFALVGTLLTRNRVPLPLFLRIIGSRSAPKSFFSSISFSKSRRMSCFERGRGKGCACARLSTPTSAVASRERREALRRNRGCRPGGPPPRARRPAHPRTACSSPVVMQRRIAARASADLPARAAPYA